MTPAHSNPDASRGHVIAFRPQMKISRGDRSGKLQVDNPDYSPIPDIGKYEPSESDDDYRHHMKMNAIAAAFTSIWSLPVCGSPI
jgi:hypothetical protein